MQEGGASLRSEIDKRPLSRFQGMLVAAGFVFLVMDGYDVQIVGYIAPVLTQLWHLHPGAFGSIFGAGLIGLTIGTLICGPVADRIGCRPVLIGCTILYGVATLVTTQVTSFDALLVMRFITGLGLGGAMPVTIAVVSDYSPTRVRLQMVAITTAGFAIGSLVGALVAAATVERFGWTSVFFIGGVMPLLLLPMLVYWFPESLPRLLSDARFQNELDRVVEKLAPGLSLSQSRVLESRKKKFPVIVLFDKGQTLHTLLIWTIAFCNLLLLYFFVNWIPTVVHGAGLPLRAANETAAVFQIFGIVGGLVVNYYSDRSGKSHILMSLAFIGAAVCCVLFDQVDTKSFTLILACAAASGFFVMGGLGGIIAYSGTHYSPEVRATGVSWALGIGRFGSILGPIFGGLLLSAQTGTDLLFTFFAAPAALAAICAFFLRSARSVWTSGSSI